MVKPEIYDETLVVIWRYYTIQNDWHRPMPITAAIRDIKAIMGLSSTSVVNYRIHRMIDMGLVEDGSYRGVRLTHTGWEKAERLYAELTDKERTHIENKIQNRLETKLPNQLKEIQHG